MYCFVPSNIVSHNVVINIFFFIVVTDVALSVGSVQFD